MTLQRIPIENVGKPVRRRQTSSTTSLDELFGTSGWQLRSGLVDTQTLANMHRLLEFRRYKLQQQFVRWSGSPVNGEGDLKSASLRLPDFDRIGIPKDLRHFLTGEFDLETRLLDEVRSLLSAETMKKQLCEFLQADHYYVHYPPMIRLKVSGVDAAMVPLHQDSAYNAHLREFVTVWIPFSDVSEESGGLRVYSGSHKEGCVTHRAGDTWASTADVDLSAHESIHVEMQAGDGLLFSSHLFHKSAPYTSPRTRFGIDLRIFRDARDTTKSYYDPFRDEVVRKN